MKVCELCKEKESVVLVILPSYRPYLCSECELSMGLQEGWILDHEVQRLIKFRTKNFTLKRGVV